MKIKYKRWLFFFADACIIIAAYWLAAFLRYEGAIPEYAMHGLVIYTALAMVLSVFLSIVCGCYNSLWQYAGVEVMFRQGIVAALSSLVLLVLRYTLIGEMSGSISVIYGILLFIMTSGIRTAPRSAAWLRTLYAPGAADLKRAVVVGAGDSGAMLIKRARDNNAEHGGNIKGGKNGERWLPVAVIDNDADKIGLKICGVKVAGDIDSVGHVCKKYNAEEIIIALPNATNDELYDIYRKCVRTNLPIKSCQNFMDVRDYLQKDKIALKSVTIEDLLFRDAVRSDMGAAEEMLKGRVVMVTGGAGSIGSELCRQSLASGCSLLIVYDLNENGLYAIDEGLNPCFEFGGERAERSRYRLCLGSVRDTRRIGEVMREYKPDIVFHAAAHKHVPMMELNPFEAIKNNVSGTVNVIDASIQNGVSKFILISTDKAVNTVNMMGASKRLAEMLIAYKWSEGAYNAAAFSGGSEPARKQKGAGMGSAEQNNGARGNNGNNIRIKTELAAVRFGNVLGSAGSVIPKFKHQIDRGGPVTLFHRDMVRYFMTIPEAVGLVLTAGTFAKGGEIFVLDMGRPVKIYDLAADLIRLAGYEPEVDIKIEVTDPRPGEKLYEELFLQNETIDKTSHEKIFVSKSGGAAEDSPRLPEDFGRKLARVIELAEEGRDEKALREAVFALAGGGGG